MNNLKKVVKIINFQRKIFSAGFGKINSVKCNGKITDNRCSSKGSISCTKDSQIIIKRMEMFDGFHFAAVDGGKIEFGDGNFFNRNCTVVARKSIKIGNMCSFGPNVCIYDHDHPFGRAKESGEQFICSDVVIGNNCWVGANTVILRGTVIGDNCVIGAGCVVKGNIPANSLVTSGRELDIRPIKND